MKPRKSRVTAGWPLPRLLAALRKARWGDLGVRQWHGLRAVLIALCELAQGDRTGRVEATAWQIAGMAGYGERWTRDRLQALEYLGVLRWWRGGVANGKPQPSIFIISRRRLADLVVEARPQREAAVEARRVKTNERLQEIRTGHAKSKEPRFRRSAHAAVSASLPPFGEASTGQTPPPGPVQPTLLATMTHTAQHEARTAAPPAPSPDNDPPGADARAMIRAQIRTSRARWAHA